MVSVFEIDQSVIQSIDDQLARELVARLCRAELRGQSVPESTVTWGGDQRAKDGGVDVRVECMTPIPFKNFVQAENTAIQVKAEKLPPKKIQQEMAPRGVLRPAIVELAKTGGSYIIVSTKEDLSDTYLKLRRKAILECLNEHGIGSNVLSDFYDSRRMADWVERHPAITIWLRQKIGRPIVGWRPYEPWAYREDDLGSEYLLDTKVKVYVPGEENGKSVSEAVTQLRSELAEPVAIRIVGLSGVGKTRLVQALFDPRVCPESPCPSSENVIYVDLADDVEPQPQRMMESLRSQESDVVVIIDNCGPDTHRRLTEVVKNKGCKLKLITVEYDIRDNLPDETLCYRLEGSSQEIITTLLKKRYPHLSENDSVRIAEFSDGNARIALALGSTATAGGELSTLRNDELFLRLFQQRKDPNEELLRCSEAASLLYSFDGVDLSTSGEVALLAGFAEVSPLTFSRQMTELKRRGLLQARGQWRAVLPHAIANGLAKRMLEPFSSDVLSKILAGHAGERVARSISRRLGYLHDSPQAVALASRWFYDGGHLKNLSELSPFEIQIFTNLAPVDRESALESLKTASQNSDFVSIKNHRRAHFASVARSIAYDPEFFDEAVMVLARFALVEPKDFNNQPVGALLKSLFSCHLSGTQAGPQQRKKVVERLISSSVASERALGLDLVRSALKTRNFSSTYGFEFGARRRDYGWYPNSKADVKLWFTTWLELIASIGERETPEGSEARVILGEALRDLWGRVGLDHELADIAARFKAMDGWPEGWLGVRRILQWDAASLSVASLTQLKDLEQRLAPSDLVTSIRAHVLARNRFPFELQSDESGEPLSPGEKYRRSLLEAESLGEKAAATPEVLDSLLPELFSKGSSEIFEFGKGIGKSHKHINELLQRARKHIELSGSENLGLIWLRGLFAGWKDVDPDQVETFLEDAVTDTVWVKWFVELQVQSTLNSQALNRLHRVLDSGLCPTGQFRYLATGRVTSTLTVSEIMGLSRKLAIRPDLGLVTAIELLNMVAHGTDEKEERYKQELGEELIIFLAGMDWSELKSYQMQVDHDLHEIIKFALQQTGSEELITHLLKHMRGIAESEWTYHYEAGSNFLQPFFAHSPRLALELICIPDADGTYQGTTRLFCDSYSPLHESVLGVVPADVLVNWCNEQAEARFLFAAGACQLFNIPSDEKSPLAFSDVALALLQAAPDKKLIVDTYISRFRLKIWNGIQESKHEQMLDALDQLAVLKNESVVETISAAKATLSRWISEEGERESRRQRTQDASFE